MTSAREFTVRKAFWTADQIPLQALRRTVFIVEQQVPELLEWDEFDAVSEHALAQDIRGNAIGTGRLLPDAHIGRMAVIGEWRRHGVGGAILEFLIECARKRGDRILHLNAQTHAIGFYQHHGFVEHGDEFLEAGIPHRQMTRRI